MTETLLPPAPPPAPGPPLHPPGAPLIPVSRRRFRLAVALPVIAGLLVLAGGGWWVAHSLRTSNAVQAGPEETAAVVNINGSVRGGTVAGSGMIIDAGGLVLTNNHVVANTTSLTAQVAGRGPVYQAEVMGVDPTHDVAVIKLKNASNLPSARLDESGAVNIGDRVVGVGNALGRNGTPVSASGSVTTLDQTLEVRDEGDTLTETLNGMVCFDADIEPGDSGGPLFNQSGQVIGMDTAGTFVAATGASAHSGCAIPITRAIAIARQIIAGKTSPYIESGHRGSLGVVVSTQLGVDGASVDSVMDKQAAALAGIKVADVIVSVGGIAVHSSADLDSAMKGRRPGDHVSVRWLDAGGGSHQATVTLSPGPPA